MAKNAKNICFASERKNYEKNPTKALVKSSKTWYHIQ